MRTSIAIDRGAASAKASKGCATQLRPDNARFETRQMEKQSFDAEAFLGLACLAAKIVNYGSSATIYTQDDPATSVLYIQTGCVKHAVINETGKEVIVRISGPGDFFGENCLAGQARPTSTATTITSSEIVVIEKQAMIRLLHSGHAFSDRFIKYVLSRMNRAESDLTDQLFNSSEKRLARTLLLLARYGAAGKVLPKVTQETLAELVGTTRPRVNFFLNKFRKRGFIEYRDGIHINNSLLSGVLHDQ
jgi:CRP/FNR family transcriptional regulator, cyclic AMP receptor protein